MIMQTQICLQPKGSAHYLKSLLRFRGCQDLLLEMQWRSFVRPARQPLQIGGMEGFHRTRFDIFGHEEDVFGPPELFTICDVQDGNFVAPDLSKGTAAKCPVVDCFHETFGESAYQPHTIAESFTDFLRQALESGTKLYWL